MTKLLFKPIALGLIAAFLGFGASNLSAGCGCGCKSCCPPCERPVVKAPPPPRKACPPKPCCPSCGCKMCGCDDACGRCPDGKYTDSKDGRRSQRNN